jgi:hypothetical protein
MFSERASVRGRARGCRRWRVLEHAAAQRRLGPHAGSRDREHGRPRQQCGPQRGVDGVVLRLAVLVQGRQRRSESEQLGGVCRPPAGSHHRGDAAPGSGPGTPGPRRVQRDRSGVLEHDPRLLLRVRGDVGLRTLGLEQVPGGEGANQPRLPVLARHRDQLLALRAEQGSGDLALERFQVESDPIAEIDEGSERFLAFAVSHGDLRADFSHQRAILKVVLRSALPGGLARDRFQKAPLNSPRGRGIIARERRERGEISL